jgi:arylsulfatase A-like enzyme
MRRRLVWMPVVLAAVAVAVAGYDRLRERSAAGALAVAPTGAINVLILMLDTVRKDRFTSERAPNLMRLAENGVWFENAWASTSWSLPAQATVLTGRHSFEHRADFPSIALDPAVLTLGEYFKRRGYVTGAFSSNSAWIVPEHLGRGFVRFDAYILEDIVRRTVAGRISERFLAKLGLHKAGRGKESQQLSAEFLQFVDDYEGRPFFAYLCYMDVNRTFHRRALGHTFWEQRATPDEVLTTYDAAIAALDERLGEMLAQLEQRGVLSRTLIVATSDHGESFGAGTLDDHDPEGHGTSLYPEQVQVPLFVVLPGAVLPQQRIERPVSIRAIPATITALLGDSASAFPGEPLLASDATSARTPELATLDYGDNLVRSVIWDGWQYIAYPSHPEREELFDLRTDPTAQRNLRDQARTELASGRAAFERLYPAQARSAADSTR